MTATLAVLAETIDRQAEELTRCLLQDAREAALCVLREPLERLSVGTPAVQFKPGYSPGGDSLETLLEAAFKDEIIVRLLDGRNEEVTL